MSSGPIFVSTIIFSCLENHLCQILIALYLNLKFLYRFLNITNIKSTKALVVQSKHGLYPNLECYIDLVLKFPCMLNSSKFHHSLLTTTFFKKINLSPATIAIFYFLLNAIYNIMLINLLYYTAILIETILPIKYLKLRSFEVKLP